MIAPSSFRTEKELNDILLATPVLQLSNLEFPAVLKANYLRKFYCTIGSDFLLAYVGVFSFVVITAKLTPTATIKKMIIQKPSNLPKVPPISEMTAKVQIPTSITFKLSNF